jgi:hypothetical protein
LSLQFPETYDPQIDAAVTRIYWEQGFLRYLLKPHLQRRVYDFIHTWKLNNVNSAKPIVLNIHRAGGKTFLLALLAIERALRHPNQEIRFGADTESQADEVVEPNIRKILEHMPTGFFSSRKNDKAGPYYLIRNPTWPAGSYPSRIWIIGCRERADKHRGKRSNVVIFDECRDIEAFEYVARVVFGPHFATMDNPLYIMSSTPPESMDHAWNRVFLYEAQLDNRYIECDSEHNEDWTTSDDSRMLELFKDRESPEWQREMLCRRISDVNRLIVPEFSDVHIVEDYKRPDVFIPLVVADGGFIDYFACMFGYVDFVRQVLVVEDSIVVNRKNTGQIASLVGERINSLYGTPGVDENGRVSFQFPMRPRKHADMTPRELADLEQIYHLSFFPAENHDPDSQIAHLRDCFARNKIRILAKNTALISQLKNAIRDSNGKLTRSETWGHWDAVMALVYMAKVAPWTIRPTPEESGIDISTQQIQRGSAKENNGFTRQFLRGSLRSRWK